MQVVKPGVEFDNLLDSPGGRLLQLSSVEDVDEPSWDDGLGGQLQLENNLYGTPETPLIFKIMFIMFNASSVPLVVNYY